MTFDLRSQGSSNIVSTNAFLESHLNRPRSRESQGRYDRTRESHVDDIFDTIIPRTEVVQDGHPHLEVDSEDGDSSSALTSDVQSVRDYEESSFGDVPPMLRTAFSNLGNSSESSAPSPERRSVRSSFKPRVPVPVRHSSRARGQSIESGSDVPDSVFYDGNILGHINAAELEAARKMLAAAELSNQHSPPRSSKKSMEAERSSTPPPIGRVRRRTESDSENGDLVRSLRPTTPETTASLQGGSTLMPLSRRHSQTSMASRQSRRSSKVKSHHATIQSSAYTQNRSSREPNLLAPGTQHSDRPQSRKDEAKGFQADREDTDDFSQHIPESRHGTDRVPRHASFTGSSTSRRPAMTAKRVLSSGALSVSARFQADRRSVLSHASSIRLPDFLSYEIFQAVLRNPTTAHQLLRFSETRLCSQNIEFLNKVS